MKMNKESSQLYKEFEKEVWLFIDEDLPDDKMLFWRQKLNEFPELNECLNDYDFVSRNYENENTKTQ